jgi:polyhydroxyalkanoate synthesis regulator phasin|tara:strand:- start:464 stop:631 length:168 start_codon:yes stop_codon:yes gene_type:complete
VVLVNRNHNLNKLKIGDILTGKEKAEMKRLELKIEALERRVKDLTLAIQLMAKQD